MNSACPCPAGDQSTRQWLTRSAIVPPPSFERRMNEFSPVMTTSCGSTIWGSAIVAPPLEALYLAAYERRQQEAARHRRGAGGARRRFRAAAHGDRDGLFRHHRRKEADRLGARAGRHQPPGRDRLVHGG